MINILIGWAMTEQCFWILWFFIGFCYSKASGKHVWNFFMFSGQVFRCWSCNSEKTWHSRTSAIETAFLEMPWTQFTLPTRTSKPLSVEIPRPPFTSHASPLGDVLRKSMFLGYVSGQCTWPRPWSRMWIQPPGATQVASHFSSLTGQMQSGT